ncbi:DUF2147 domain-containing protein [Prosthecomicrobium pneumaticum]|uniref:Uncharacterized protein (DUF2147 family) n=1 Tax=Prosthecomicrobium pneumaticum TaxID=81895 RepID=A0A7W9FKT5_9HYPH|nr:DUF2147 domain-containing protein [Prosthecomicrobium pneumaticum]MBB5751513.1 uncharacterized protein (DUF2147 family) [Prosthecomicrobium pneumaticum]
MAGPTTLRPLLAFAVALVAGPAIAAEPDPRGIWARDDGNARVRIAPCGAALCATNLWIRDTSKGEAVGDVLIMDVEPAGATLRGTAQDPKRGLRYSIRISRSGDRLQTRGCMLGGLLCKTVGWSRLP